MNNKYIIESHFKRLPMHSKGLGSSFTLLPSKIVLPCESTIQKSTPAKGFCISIGSIARNTKG